MHTQRAEREIKKNEKRKQNGIKWTKEYVVNVVRWLTSISNANKNEQRKKYQSPRCERERKGEIARMRWNDRLLLHTALTKQVAFLRTFTVRICVCQYRIHNLLFTTSTYCLYYIRMQRISIAVSQPMQTCKRAGCKMSEHKKEKKNQRMTNKICKHLNDFFSVSPSHCFCCELRSVY